MDPLSERCLKCSASAPKQTANSSSGKETGVDPHEIHIALQITTLLCSVHTDDLGIGLEQLVQNYMAISIHIYIKWKISLTRDYCRTERV